MKFSLLVRPEAEQDLREAYQWYEKQKLGLGEDFLGRVEEVLSSIKDHPKSYSKIFKEVRRVLVQRFPYAVLYPERGAHSGTSDF